MISFGITISEFKADRPEHLSYAAATIVAILTKDWIDGAEMWEAEVSSCLRINLRNSHLYFTIVSDLTRLNYPTFLTVWCLMKILYTFSYSERITFLIFLQIDDRRGYIQPAAINELAILCIPAEVVSTQLKECRTCSP